MMFPNLIRNRVNNCDLNYDQNNLDYDFWYNWATLIESRPESAAEVIGDLNQASFCAMLWSKAGLELFKKITVIKIDL